MTVHIAAALFVSLLAIGAIRKGLDVRFVLLAAGFLMAGIAGNVWTLFNAFQTTVGKGDVIGPICTAMGYAFVLKATGADREMVLLLTKPLKKLRWLMVPGGCLIGFVTNMAITSQTASAAALGPILIPLMISQRFSPLAAAATLLVGCSVGGNLFNPGEPDIVAIRNATQADVSGIINSVVVPNIIGFLVATAVLTYLIHRFHKASTANEGNPANTPETAAELPKSTNIALAILPPLPVIILLLLQPNFNLIPPLFEIYPQGLFISTVMLICSGLAMAFTVRGSAGLVKHISSLTVEFFEGMGYGFAKVISIILAAACFIAGLEALGAIKETSALLVNYPALAVALSPLLTWILAIICGSGTAPSVSFSASMLPEIARTNVGGAIQLGTTAAIGANIGRTMSPVSAILLFTSTLANVATTEIIKLVSIPLVSALLAVILYSVFS
ncbi:MAG: C4-dicarboxylate transporter DcuC [Ignavibacteria bacterium]|nr:C4-dicarboxylate transporter DcuC [Ignavibacteria bacterium]